MYYTKYVKKIKQVLYLHNTIPFFVLLLILKKNEIIFYLHDLYVQRFRIAFDMLI